MKYFFMLAFFILGGCDSKPTTPVLSNAIVTSFQHEGHKFVMARTVSPDTGVAILHHPSCDCLKK